MKNILLLVTFLACGFFCQSAFSQNTPWIKVETIETIPPQSPFKPEYAEGVKPSSAMAAVLKAYNPDFVAWTIADFPPKRIEHYPFSAKSLPYAVKGDFNGDGIADLALAGHDKTTNMVVVLMSQSTQTYTAVAINKLELYPASLTIFTPDEILVTVNKGEQYYSGDSAAEPTTLIFDGFKTKWIKNIKRHIKSKKITLTDTKSSPISIRVWDEKEKEFSDLMGGCNAPSSKAYTDHDYCF